MVRNLPAMLDTQAQLLDWEDPLEKETATHSSILAWRIPWTEEPGGLQSTGWQRVIHDWTTNTFSLTSMVILDWGWIKGEVPGKICSHVPSCKTQRGTWREISEMDKNKYCLISLIKCQSFSRIQLFRTPWTIAHQVPLLTEFSRQEYWSRLSFPSPGDLPNQGLNPDLLHGKQILYWAYQTGNPITYMWNLKNTTNRWRWHKRKRLTDIENELLVMWGNRKDQGSGWGVEGKNYWV